MQFCGGITTDFPGTSTLESNFSVINLEYDEFRALVTESCPRKVFCVTNSKNCEDMIHLSAVHAPDSYRTLPGKSHLIQGHSISSITHP
jgi:hypothetical protein